MALTKISRGLLNTGVADSSDATFLTVDSSEAATFAGNLTVSGNLTVTGTSTTVDTVTMNAQNAVVFEGATADAYETTLSIVDPTSSDKTQYLLNQTGYIPLLAASTTTTITSTPAELNILDGGTSATGTTLADADRLVVNDNGTMVQVALTDLETYMETSLDTLSNVTSLGTLTYLTVDNLGINGNTITANSGALNLTPASGSAIVLDGTINVDAGVVTGATSITSTALVGALTGNASTATALASARTIGGTSFDGTANIAVGLAATATALATARTIGGTSFDGTANIAVGLAATATALASARTIGGTSFDGTANIVPGTATEATNVTAAANNSTDETVYPTFVDGATGTQGIETDTGLTYNPSTGVITATQFTGNVTGNVTGNTSGTAATVTTAAQPAITSLGTLSSLAVGGNQTIGGTLGVTHASDSQATTIKAAAANENAYFAVGNSDMSDFILLFGGHSGNDGSTVGWDDSNILRFSTYTNHTGSYGNTRMQIGTSGQIGIGGANYGTDGQVLTSTGASTAPAWEDAGGGAVSAINNATANELVTIGSTTTELDAEANLTFDGGTLTITQGSDSQGLYVDMNGNERAIYVDYAGTTNDALQILGSALTTGKLAYFYSNSANTGTRDLVRIRNDNTLATGTTSLLVEQDSTGPAAVILGDVGIGVSDPDCALEVSGTDAMSVPSGTTAQRPTARNGMIRYNSTEDQMECHEDDSWKTFDTTIPDYDVEYLVVAGGGGSSFFLSGGGGAGGYRTATGFTLTPSTSYTVTVGAGGAAGADSAAGSNGEDSVFSTITSTGGGRGGVHPSDAGVSGGSGSGGALRFGAGGSGTAGQGNDGGTGGKESGNESSGGGGGAGAVGGDGHATLSIGGDGGVGLSSSITGSAVYYAGGGGGCAVTGGTVGSGGNGGGGDGGLNGQASNGTVNTGGGAGGGGGSGSGAGASGGSGVVILRIPTANYSGTTSGSPTVTTDGDYTVVKFTGSGTYTA